MGSAIAHRGLAKPLLLALADRGESINDDATLEEIEKRRSPSVQVVNFKGAGHNLHRTNFEDLAKALADWLERSNAGSAGESARPGMDSSAPGR